MMKTDIEQKGAERNFSYEGSGDRDNECSGIFRRDSYYEDGEPNEITYKAMMDAERGIDVVGPFESVEEMLSSLNS